MSIQSHDVVDAFREMLAAPDYRSRRLAFVVGYTLVRSQAIRAVGSREAGWFSDSETAEAWLLAEEHGKALLRRAVG
jgi:hypothetical protein